MSQPQQNPQTFDDFWILISAMFPVGKTDAYSAQVKMGVYRDALAEYPPNVLYAAALYLVRTKTFFPTIAEILQAIFDLTVEYQANGRPPNAYDAWAGVKRQLGRTVEIVDGVYQMPDPIATLVMHQLGWKAYGLSSPKDEPSWRARFVESYEAELRRAVFSPPARLREIARAGSPVMIEGPSPEAAAAARAVIDKTGRDVRAIIGQVSGARRVSPGAGYEAPPVGDENEETEDDSGLE